MGTTKSKLASLNEKLDTLERRLELVEVQKKKVRSRHKKLKAYDLSSLTEFLPELKGSWQPAPAPEFKHNCKSRQKLILKEGKQRIH
ncbi:hypothetical protein ACOSQ3_005333 [Xanthoceras sorbifolium]